MAETLAQASVRSELTKEGAVEIKKYGCPKYGNRAVYLELKDETDFPYLSNRNATPFDFPSDISN